MTQEELFQIEVSGKGERIKIELEMYLNQLSQSIEEARDLNITVPAHEIESSRLKISHWTQRVTGVLENMIQHRYNLNLE